MTVYCDVLCPSAVLRISGLILSERLKGKIVRLVYFEKGNRFSSLSISVLQCLGVEVSESDMWLNGIFCSDGETLAGKARKVCITKGLELADGFLSRSALLGELEREWGKGCIRKYFAMGLETVLFNILPLMIALEMSLTSADGDRIYLMRRRTFISAVDAAGVMPSWRVLFYGFRSEGCYKNACPGIDLPFMSAFAFVAALIVEWIRSLTGNKVSLVKPAKSGFLLLQEDEINLDSSYRRQPHWQLAEESFTDFYVYILRTGAFEHTRERSREQERSLAEKNIFFISMEKAGFVYMFSSPETALRKSLRRSLKACLHASVFGTYEERGVIWPLIGLLRDAAGMADLCDRHDIKVFMTAENYLRSALAMQMAAPLLGVMTFSYQYSNMAILSSSMMNASDVMFTWSPYFDSVWKNARIRPKALVNIGYLYDGYVEKVKPRADALRAALKAKGVHCVICFFDENREKARNGLVTVGDHAETLEKLFSMVLSDPTMGLVMKVQFQSNQPAQVDRLGILRDQLLQSGRYVELSKGTVPNIVMPCEAAISADITIGYKFGATASLEAALAGVRAILLDPFHIVMPQDVLYDQCDIVYHSLDEVLDAIAGFRRGDPTKASLGDWSKILHHFDPYRDGKSADRMRKKIAEALIG